MEEFRDELLTTVNDGMAPGYSEVNPEDEIYGIVGGSLSEDEENEDPLADFEEDEDFDMEPTDEELMELESQLDNE